MSSNEKCFWTLYNFWPVCSPISLSDIISRVMDCFLLYGIEIIFRIALTLLSIGKHELLLLDIEGVIKV